MLWINNSKGHIPEQHRYNSVIFTFSQLLVVQRMYWRAKINATLFEPSFASSPPSGTARSRKGVTIKININNNKPQSFQIDFCWSVGTHNSAFLSQVEQALVGLWVTVIYVDTSHFWKCLQIQAFVGTCSNKSITYTCIPFSHLRLEHTCYSWEKRKCDLTESLQCFKCCRNFFCSPVYTHRSWKLLQE